MDRVVDSGRDLLGRSGPGADARRPAELKAPEGLGRRLLSGVRGLAEGLLRWWRWALLSGVRPGARPRRMALIERIALGPRQSLALVEVDGARLLVTLSPEGAPGVVQLAHLAQLAEFAAPVSAHPGHPGARSEVRPQPAGRGPRRRGRVPFAGPGSRPGGARW